MQGRAPRDHLRGLPLRQLVDAQLQFRAHPVLSRRRAIHKITDHRIAEQRGNPVPSAHVDRVGRARHAGGNKACPNAARSASAHLLTLDSAIHEVVLIAK